MLYHLDAMLIFRYHVPITSGDLLLFSTLAFRILTSTDLIWRDK
jgi:hypothetical protein